MKSRFIVIALCCSVLGAPALGQENPVDKSKLARFLLSGLKEQRELLTSGRFRVHGERISRQKNAERGSHITFDASCEFDRSLRRLRYDESFTDVYGITGREKTRSDSIQYVRTESLSIHVPTKDSISISIMAPEYPLMGGDGTPFDPRVLGLVSDVELKSGIPEFGFAQSFSSVFKAYSNEYTVEFVEELPDGVYVIGFVFGKQKELRKMLWIDSTRGFTPDRLEIHRKPVQEEVGARPVVLTEAKWQQIDSVWVPKEARMESHFNDDAMRIALTWEAVNEPVDDVVFTIEGLDLPATVPLPGSSAGPKDHVRPEIVDHRQASPIVLQRQEFVEAPTASPTTKE